MPALGPAMAAAVCWPKAVARRASIISSRTKTLGIFLGLTAILSSHFPSALMRTKAPSILHLAIALYGMGSLDFQITPADESEIFPKETVPPELSIRSASWRKRGFAACKTRWMASSCLRIFELILIVLGPMIWKLRIILSPFLVMS